MLVITHKIFLEKFLERKKNYVEWAYKDVPLKDILFPAWGTLFHLCSCSLSLCMFQLRRQSKAISYSAEAFQSLSHYLCNFCWGLSWLSPLNFKFQHLSGKKSPFSGNLLSVLSDKAEFKRGTFEKSLLPKNLKSRGSSCTGICGAHHHQNRSAWSRVAQSSYPCVKGTVDMAMPNPTLQNSTTRSGFCLPLFCGCRN